MIQMISALLAGAFLLASCSREPRVNNAIDTEATQLMCVHSYDASEGSISIYFDTAYKFVPKIQHISEVADTTADETIASLGMCSEILTEDGRTN